MNVLKEVSDDLLIKDLGLAQDSSAFHLLEEMITGDTKYIKDLKSNLKAVLVSDFLSAKEALLIALSIVVNEKNDLLINAFKVKALEAEASPAEVAETIACASMLAVNNIFYRFRHFTQKEAYQNLQARLRMSIMLKPVLGKEYFELMSLAVSSVNGCEMCVNAHEDSLIKLGTKEERIFDAIRIASVVVGLSKVVR